MKHFKPVVSKNFSDTTDESKTQKKKNEASWEGITAVF